MHSQLSPLPEKFGSGGIPWRERKPLLSLLQAEGAGEDRMGAIGVGCYCWEAASQAVSEPAGIKEPGLGESRKLSWDKKWLCRVGCNPEISEPLA